MANHKPRITETSNFLSQSGLAENGPWTCDMWKQIRDVAQAAVVAIAVLRKLLQLAPKYLRLLMIS